MNINNNSQLHSMLKGYNMLLYFAGTMIMYEPNEECIVDFWTNGILKNLPVSSTNPNFIKAAAQLRESCIDKKVCREKLLEDYTRLFSNEQNPLAPPYESLNIFEINININDRQSVVSDFYKSYGWKSKFYGKIEDDHLGIELLFLTLLIDKFILLEDDACNIEMKKEIQRFISSHLLSWLPVWNKKMEANSGTLCFKGISTLILACSEDIYELLDQRQVAFKSEIYLKN